MISNQKPLLTDTPNRPFYRIDHVGGPYDWALVEFKDGEEKVLVKDMKNIVQAYLIGLIKNDFDKSRLQRLRDSI